MKIGNNIESKPAEMIPRPGPDTRDVSSGSKEVSSASPVDKVALSDTSRKIASTDSVDQPVRAERVAEVKTAIIEGKFRISPEVIADRMISAAAELIENMASGGEPK
jgi:negative regulator of flagellin synthesis FlgM